MISKTLCIIKPSAVKENLVGKILSRIENAGFRISGLKMIRLDLEKAKQFYSVHEDKSFFNALAEYMASGQIVVSCLEKINAVEDYRKLIGHTNPESAEEGTLRKLYGISLQKNAVHGSDSDENAIKEINFFFRKQEIF